MKQLSLILIASALLLAGCEQSDPPTDVRIGDELTFSGYEWEIKHSEAPVGPGPNPFSNRADDVFIDPQGRLHLKIVEHDGIWYSTEVVSKMHMGYGTYRWTVTGDLTNIPSNIVLGLFTWDNETFFTDGNSEVDIEFAYWGDDSTKTSSLLYSVQPVFFSQFFPERTYHPDLDGDLFVGTTTHEFTWTPDLITWKSHKGPADNMGEQIASWSFDKLNKARRKLEGGNRSDPIVIPSPGENTNARMNFWIASHVETFPVDNQEHEVIIDSFSFEPM